MIKALVIASIVAIAASEEVDYPEFDLWHTNCAMQVTYHKQNCHQIYNQIYKKVRNTMPEYSSCD